VSSEQSAEPVAAEPAPLPRRRAGIVAVVAVLALALDIVTKQIVVADLEGKAPVKLLGGLFYLDVIRNPGAAFSMATGMTWVLSLIALAVVIAIIVLARRLRSVGWAVGLGLVLAGALGNLLDRFFRSPGPFEGHVVDFISPFKPWGEAFAVFNAADSCITIGGILIVLMAVLGRDYDGGAGRLRKLADEKTKQDNQKAESA
jgi:signal peptidase II